MNETARKALAAYGGKELWMNAKTIEAEVSVDGWAFTMKARPFFKRATMAFVVGNVAASADQEAVVLLTIEGVWNATRSYADKIHKEGFQPLLDVMQSFVNNGGQIWVCGACAKPRGITEADLVEGARIITAANAVEYLASGAASLSF